MKKILFLAGWLLPLFARSQSYSITSYAIADGGGSSAGGAYQVTGTIGQPDASAALTGGNFSLTGGFWSFLVTPQTPGAPPLTISQIGNQIVVSWPMSFTGWTLQTNPSLAGGAWGNYAGVVNHNAITISPGAGTIFFRLSHP